MSLLTSPLMCVLLPLNSSLPHSIPSQEDFLIETRVSGSRIYRSQCLSSGQTMENPIWALKIVPPETIESRKPHNVRKEAIILSKLSHLNVRPRFILALVLIQHRSDCGTQVSILRCSERNI
jgi:hypothetical protein